MLLHFLLGSINIFVGLIDALLGRIDLGLVTGLLRRVQLHLFIAQALLSGIKLLTGSGRLIEVLLPFRLRLLGVGFPVCSFLRLGPGSSSLRLASLLLSVAGSVDRGGPIDG